MIIFPIENNWSWITIRQLNQEITQWLNITKNVSFQSSNVDFWHFENQNATNFSLKNFVARFARNVEKWDFFSDFWTWCWKNRWERRTVVKILLCGHFAFQSAANCKPLFKDYKDSCQVDFFSAKIRLFCERSEPNPFLSKM